MPHSLYLLSAVVDDWAGDGAAVIQWIAVKREAPPVPYEHAIAHFAELPPQERQRVAQSVNRFLTREEALLLGQRLRQRYRDWHSRLSYGVVTLPITAGEVLAMQPPDPTAAQDTIALVEPPPGIKPLHSGQFLGVASPWPWPDLSPSNVAALIALRQELGFDPVPPAPTAGASVPRESY